MTPWKFIIAGKEEGFKFSDAKVVLTSYKNSDEYPYEAIQALKEEGYTQFFLVEQYAYEFMVNNGEYVKGKMK